MATIFQAPYPLFSATGNFSGTHAAVKSAGAVNSSATHDAGSALQRTGHVGLAQFGFIQLPREVLFLHDERAAKVKATRDADQVQATSKTDLDADQGLDKAREASRMFAEERTARLREERVVLTEEKRDIREEKIERLNAPDEFAPVVEKARDTREQREITNIRAAETRDAQIFALAKAEKEQAARQATITNREIREADVRTADEARARGKPQEETVFEISSKEKVRAGAAEKVLIRQEAVQKAGEERRLQDEAAAKRVQEKVEFNREQTAKVVKPEGFADKLAEQVIERQEAEIRNAPRQRAIEEVRAEAGEPKEPPVARENARGPSPAEAYRKLERVKREQNVESAPKREPVDIKA